MAGPKQSAKSNSDRRRSKMKSGGSQASESQTSLTSSTFGSQGDLRSASAASATQSLASLSKSRGSVGGSVTPSLSTASAPAHNTGSRSLGAATSASPLVNTPINQDAKNGGGEERPASGGAFSEVSLNSESAASPAFQNAISSVGSPSPLLNVTKVEPIQEQSAVVSPPVPFPEIPAPTLDEQAKPSKKVETPDQSKAKAPGQSTEQLRKIGAPIEQPKTIETPEQVVLGQQSKAETPAQQPKKVASPVAHIKTAEQEKPVDVPMTPQSQREKAPLPEQPEASPGLVTTLTNPNKPSLADADKATGCKCTVM